MEDSETLDSGQKSISKHLPLLMELRPEARTLLEIVADIRPAELKNFSSCLELLKLILLRRRRLVKMQWRLPLDALESMGHCLTSPESLLLLDGRQYEFLIDRPDGRAQQL